MMLAVDIETYKSDDKGRYVPLLSCSQFVLGCVMDEKLKERYFYTPETMYTYIIDVITKAAKSGKRVFVYGHNHEYDFYGYMKKEIFQSLFSEDPMLRVYLWNPLFATYGRNGYFVDTMSFYKMALSELGKIVGLPKLEMPEEVTSVEQLKPYIYRDTLIVMKAMQKFKNALSILGYKPRKMITSGQVSMTALQTYLKRQGTLHIVMPNGEILKSPNHKLVRLAFKGARVQAFQTGLFKNVYSYDQNSQHPYVETIMPFPDLSTEIKVDNPLHLSTAIGVSYVTILAPDIKLPYLPINYNKRQVYPRRCIMTGVWTNMELNYALTLGYTIHKIYWTIKYKEGFNPLREYQLKLWELRKSSSDEMKIAIKLLMNSVGMKFSQRNENYTYKVVPRHMAFDKAYEDYQFDGFSGVNYIMKKSEGVSYPRYYNPIISTLITSWSRHVLYLDLMKVKQPLYCDTDSITTIGDQSGNLNIGPELGQWKRTAAKERCHILGEKKYYVGDDIRASGVPSRFKTKEMMDLGQDIEIQRMISFNEAKKRGNLDLMGEFETVTINLSLYSKLDEQLPPVITEVIK